MGGWYPNVPIYQPREPSPKEPDPPQAPPPSEKQLLVHYQNLRMEISDLEATIASDWLTDKELDKAIVLLKLGAKLIKGRLRTLGFSGPMRVRVPECVGEAGDD